MLAIKDYITQTTTNKDLTMATNHSEAAETLMQLPLSSSSPSTTTTAAQVPNATSSNNTVISAESSENKPVLTMEDFVEIEKAHYTFPERLMELLEEEQAKEAMWWLPGGNAFAIRPKIFYDLVLSKYFQGTKFESFTRKLNRWGFRRLASQQGVPSSTNAYYHKLFKRGQPDLVKKMRSGNKGQFSEVEKHQPSPQMSAFSALVHSAPAAAPLADASPQTMSPFSTNNASDETQAVREYLTNQSIVAARLAQHQQQQQQQQEEKERNLLAALQLRNNMQQPFGVPQNLVSMQKRVRLMAAQQFASLHGQETASALREQLFSRIGMGLLDLPSSGHQPFLAHHQQAPQLSSQMDSGLTSQQLVQLMLLREQFGGQQNNLL